MTEAEELELLELERERGGAKADPWAQIGAAKSSGVVQEMHPDVTLKDRLVLKNFASNPESMVKYLQKEHPQLEVQADPTGQIRMKRMNEKEYRVLDPDTGVFSGLAEMGRDLGDVGYDIASGIGTSAATAAGGLAGAAGGAGVGALPGAIAAGASSSAALEAGRQGIGSMLGIEDNMDGTQIALSGATGAVSPLLFGTGAGVKEVAGKGLAGKLAALGGYKGVTGEAAEGMLRSQSGLPGMAFRKVTEDFAPGVGRALSGVSKQGVEDAAANLKNLDAFDADPAMLTRLVEESSDDLAKKITERSNSQWKELTTHIDENSGGKIDLKKAIQPYWEEVQAANAAYRENPVPLMAQQRDEAMAEFQRLWGKPKIRMGADGSMTVAEDFYVKSPKILQKIKTEIGDVADFNPYSGKPPPSDIAQRIAKKAYKGINESIESAAPGAKKIREELAQTLEDKKIFYKEFQNPDKFVARAQTASTSKLKGKALAETIKNLDKRYGGNLNKARGTVNAVSIFGKDTDWKRKGLGATIGGIAGYSAVNQSGGADSFGGAPGYIPGALLGAALTSPKALRLILELSQKSNAAGANAGAKAALINQIGLKAYQSNDKQKPRR